MLTSTNDPFSSGSNFQLVREAGAGMLTSLPFDDVFFKTDYGAIALEWYAGHPPADFGTAEHAKQLWGELATAVLFQRTGTYMKSNRWNAFQIKYRERKNASRACVWSLATSA